MERLKLNIQRFASGTITFADNGNMSGKIEWSSTVVGSTAAEKAQLNKSSVTAILYVRRNDGLSTWGDFTGYLSIHESTQNFYPVWITASSSWVEVARKTIEVQHNNNGTGSALITGSVTGPTETTWEGKMVTGSKVVTLDTIPRYTTVSTWSVTSRTETSITLSWKTADTCSQIRYGTSTSSYTTANVNSNSGTVTISGLQAGQTYTLYFMPKRKDSSLWGDGSDSTWKSLANQSTQPYPYAETMPAFTIGENPTIGIKNPLNRTFTITVYGADNSVIYTGSNKTGTSIKDILNGATEVNKLYQSLPTAKSGKYKVKIDTSLPSSTTKESTNLYSVDETANKPIFNDFTYADINSTTTALTGDDQKVIQGYSNIQATISVANKATAQHYATMDHYDLIIQGNTTQLASYSDEEDVTIVVNNANSGSIKVNAVDSRNIPKEVPKTAVLIPYTNIQRGNISVTRAGNVGEATTLVFNGTLWEGDFGAVTNTITSVQYRFKSTASGSQWSAYASLTPPTPSGSNYSFSGLIAGDEGNTGFSVDNSFNIEVIVSDRLSSITFTATLGTGIPHVAFGDNGIAIKQPYDDNDNSVLQVNGATTINGQTKILGTAGSKPLMTRGIVGSNTDCTAIDDLYLQYGTGKKVHFDNAGNTTIDSDGNMKVAKSIQIPKNSGAGYGLTNSDGTSIIKDYNNNCVTVDATGDTLFLGFSNTTGLNLLRSKGSLDSSGNLTISGKYKSTGISIVDAGNNWKKVDIGFCRVYFKKDYISSRSYGGNGWGYGADLPLPTNLKFDQYKMAFACNGRADDQAIDINFYLNHNQTSIFTGWRNKYGNAVTTTINYNALIIDFS